MKIFLAPDLSLDCLILQCGSFSHGTAKFSVDVIVVDYLYYILFLIK